MVNRKNELKKILKPYLDSMRDEIKINYAILFGSYAKGNPREESDIDIAVVSEDFGVNHLEKMQYLSVKRLDSDASIEGHPFSLKDYHNREKGDFLSGILETGIIVERNE
jgi:predicted nucleotidyltransferase